MTKHRWRLLAWSASALLVGALALVAAGCGGSSSSSSGGTTTTTGANTSGQQSVGKGEGKQYTDFIVKELKPWVDANYRTRPGRKDTGIMGSSMGGLASHYALFQYPEVFSMAGIFSPAYWTAPPVAESAKPFLREAARRGSRWRGSRSAPARAAAPGRPGLHYAPPWRWTRPCGSYPAATLPARGSS